MAMPADPPRRPIYRPTVIRRSPANNSSSVLTNSSSTQEEAAAAEVTITFNLEAVVNLTCSLAAAVVVAEAVHPHQICMNSCLLMSLN